ncbi:MAG: hypothetical protein Q7U06_01175 [Pseudomonadota bacterium]|nr:hypothetical protein [Pseudomonadota bacterium]
MSKTLTVLLTLALVWLVAWGIAGYFMAQAGNEKLAQADHVSAPATRLERGADVRVEGTLVEGPSAVSWYGQKPCLAAVTYISATGFYHDSRNKPAHESQLVATRSVGPPNLEIAVGDARIQLPLERWSPRSPASESTDELPARLGVTPEEIASAKGLLRGSFVGFTVSESTIDAGARVFVVGRLEDSEGPLRLEADRVLGRVELYPGSQDDFVKELGDSGGGLRIAGWILGAGLGPLPLALIGLVLLASRGKRSDARQQGAG